MGDLSKHFNRSEFDCKCNKCTPIAVDYELVNILEDIREHFGVPVKVTSSYRCESHNKAVGGAKNSKHKLGIAADIQLKGIDPMDVYSYLNSVYPNSYGFGLYNTFVHVDARSSKARWNG